MPNSFSFNLLSLQKLSHHFRTCLVLPKWIKFNLWSLLSSQQQRVKKYIFSIRQGNPCLSLSPLSPNRECWQSWSAELLFSAHVQHTAERAVLPGWQPPLEQHPSYNRHLEKGLEIQICGTSALLEMKLGYRFGIQIWICFQTEEPGTCFNAL